MSAVFDASVVVKWFVEDSLADAAVQAGRTYRPAIAPSLMLVEVANVLRRYVIAGDLTADVARDALAAVAELVELLDEDILVDEAFALACRLNHSMTDCLYAVLARRMNLPLITADAKLARKLSMVEDLEVRMLTP